MLYYRLFVNLLIITKSSLTTSNYSKEKNAILVLEYAIFVVSCVVEAVFSELNRTAKFPLCVWKHLAGLFFFAPKVLSSVGLKY